MTELTFKKRVLGGLWGAVVGDALGVPVEFSSRDAMQRDPVADLRGHGTHNQPKGTWSDDASLMLCTVDSLLAHSFDEQDIGGRFVRWSRGELWTPWGRVFDIGSATSAALRRIEQGVPTAQAGGADESSNGNGSLMRILPIALRFASEPPERLLDFAHRASAITHRHPRSQMACGFYCVVAASLVKGDMPSAAHAAAIQIADTFYRKPPFAAELPRFDKVFSVTLGALTEREIASGGYVLDTLTAALWCLLTSKDFSESVLKAVNLGGNTDTTGIVAGGLAGICRGVAAVPQNWRTSMARAGDLATVFERFATSCT
jgi:ADP-ribosyl-[dinitrogen reductase] hydrolase